MYFNGYLEYLGLNIIHTVVHVGFLLLLLLSSEHFTFLDCICPGVFILLEMLICSHTAYTV